MAISARLNLIFSSLDVFLALFVCRAFRSRHYRAVGFDIVVVVVKKMRHWSFFHLIPKAHIHTLRASTVYTGYESSNRLVAELCKMPTIQFLMNPQEFQTMLHLVLCRQCLLGTVGTIYAHNRLFLAFALLCTCWSSLLSIPPSTFPPSSSRDSLVSSLCFHHK